MKRYLYNFTYLSHQSYNLYLRFIKKLHFLFLNIFIYNSKALNTIKEHEDILRDVYPHGLPTGSDLYDLAEVFTFIDIFIYKIFIMVWYTFSTSFVLFIFLIILFNFHVCLFVEMSVLFISPTTYHI